MACSFFRRGRLVDEASSFVYEPPVTPPLFAADLHQFLTSFASEFVVKPGRHQFREFLARLLPLAELFERLSQQPACLRLERGAGRQNERPRQVTGCVEVLAAQGGQLAVPEERLSVRLVGGKGLLPLL